MAHASDTAARKVIVIAVDGPAASGKGTIARKISEHMGFAYLDTGSLYRIVAKEILAQGRDPENPGDIGPLLAAVHDKFTPQIFTDPALRSPEVADAAAKIATIIAVRTVVHEYQVEFAKNPPGGAPGVVIDGRDIGTVICPDADVKLFITASPEERARRRYAELKDRTPGLTYEQVLAAVNERDRKDTTRPISPLKPAADAYIRDNSNMTPDQAVEDAIGVVHSVLNRPAGSTPKPSRPGP